MDFMEIMDIIVMALFGIFIVGTTVLMCVFMIIDDEIERKAKKKQKEEELKKRAEKA